MLIKQSEFVFTVIITKSKNEYNPAAPNEDRTLWYSGKYTFIMAEASRRNMMNIMI